MSVPHEDEHGEEDDEDMGVVETYADYMPAKREEHTRHSSHTYRPQKQSLG